MKRTKYILTLFLTSLYMLSMAHTLFHAQLHAFLERGIAECCATNITHNCNCPTHRYKSCCKNSTLTSFHCCHHLTDQGHNCKCKEFCSANQQYVPSESRYKSITREQFLALLPYIPHFVKPISDKPEVEYFRLIEEIPISPDIRFSSLRAPPVIC